MRTGALAFAVLLAAASPVFASEGKQSQTQIAPVATTQLAPAGVADGPGDETRSNGFDKRIPGTGTGLARVPADHVPAPAPNSIALVNNGFSGFLGLTHRDQRFAGTGVYTNTQFSLEPPDQGLCVGNGFVVEAINTAIAVYSTGGTRLAGPVPFNQFFGLAPEVIRTNPRVFGDFTSDPKCYFDPDLQRWFITILQLDVDPSSGNFTGPTHVFIAVSASADPRGSYNVFVIDTTDLSHPGCPCLGDQPLIGADANGFYVSTNEFPLFTNGFNGPQLDGTVFTVQPATTPKGGGYATAAGGTEYFLNSFFTGSLENRIVLWALSNTSSLARPNPSLALTHTVLDTEVYGNPPASTQKPGPTPLADLLNAKLEFIDSDDDRMNQVVFAGGLLWSAVATPVKTPNGPTTTGAAWFAVAPSASGGAVAAQGYISVARESVLYPAVGVNADGKAMAVFTVVGPHFFPAAAYAPIDLSTGAGEVHIAAAGAGPDDGFTGYGGFRVARWGDYSALVADENGNLWMATEFIPDAPRSVLANWGTFVSRIAP